MRVQKTILVRPMCLTNYTLSYIRFPRGWKRSLFTGQRLDFAMKVSEFPGSAESCEVFRKFSRRTEADFRGLYARQGRDIFSESNVAMLVLDSFSELFDTRFANKSTGREFCSVYGALDRKGEFAEIYEDMGRLPIEGLEDCYRTFFSRFNSIYGEVPIVYLAFSHAFEDREVYKSRGVALGLILERLASEFSNLHVYGLDFVEKRPDDDHNYHYSDEMYRRLAKRIVRRETGLSMKWRCPRFLARAAEVLFQKRKLEGGVRQVKMLGLLTFSYRSRKRRS